MGADAMSSFRPKTYKKLEQSQYERTILTDWPRSLLFLNQM